MQAGSTTAFTWQEIEQDWLGGSSGLAAAADDVVVAFNTVAAYFGRDWVEASRARSGGPTRGMWPTLHIVALGRRFAALDGIPNSQVLLDKLRRHQPDAIAELTSIYLIRAGNPEGVVETEPEIRVGARNRKPDFRVMVTGQPWTYVEVTNPNESGAQRDVLRGIEQLTSLLEECTGSFALEVFLKREPTAAELGELQEHIMRGHRNTARSEVELPLSLGTMYWNHQQPGNAVLENHGEAYTPRLGRMAAVIADGDHRHVMVRWPFTDTRVETFIRHEARQLPTDAPGLIMIQTSGTVGAMKAWRSLIEPRFQPRLHTRVSAVCLFGSAVRPTPAGEEWTPACKIISNPHARFPLPLWITQQLGRFPSDEPDI